MKKLCTVLVSAVAFSLTASAESYNYTPGDTTLGGGAVTITYAEGTTDIETFTANPANGGTITLTGGAATFAAGATLTLASTGTVAFAEKVTTKGALTLVRGDDAYIVWTGASALTEPDPGILAFPGISTNDIDACVCVVAGIPSSSSYENVGGRYDAVGGLIGNNEFVALNRVACSFVYSIRVQLSPTADGIYARCRTGVRSPRFGLYPDQEASWARKSLWASWPKSNKDWGYYGYSTDVNSVGGTYLGRIADMGLNRIVLRRKGKTGGAMKVSFDGGVALGGTTTIPFGMEAVVATSEGDGAVDLSQTINGEGDLTLLPMPATTAFAGTTYMEGFISSSSWKVLAENRSLATLTNIEGYMQGGSHNAAQDPSKCGTFFYRYNAADDTATCQFQYKRTATTTKYVVAKLRQNVANVEIAGVGYGYADPGTYGTEFPTKAEKTANYTTSWSSKVSTLKDESLGYGDTSNYTDGYGIRMITATFGGATTKGVATISGDLKTLYGGRLKMSGREGFELLTVVSSLTGFPAGGEAHIRDCRVFLTAGSDAPGGGTTSLFVHQGGELRNVNVWQIDSFQDLWLDGGTYNGFSTTLYLNHIVLSNATMTGTSPRAGNANLDQSWRVIGDAPSFITCNNGANVYGSSGPSTSRVFRMDVNDVTGDSAVDCTLRKIRGAGDRVGNSDRENYTWFAFEKRGDGTLKITEDSRELRLASKLYGGTLLLAGSNIMTNEVQLLGGNIAVDAGKSNSLGALTANGAGTVAIGAGGSLTFASFAPAANLAEKSITIDAPMDGNVLKFGATLTREQQRRFRWKDTAQAGKFWNVYQTPDGYIHPNTLGVVITIR